MANNHSNSVGIFPRHLATRLFVELPASQPYVFYAYFGAVIWWVSGYWAAGLYYSLTGEVPVALRHIGLGGMSLGLTIGGLVSRKWWLLCNAMPFIYSLNLLQSMEAEDGLVARGFGLITVVTVLGLIGLEVRRFRSREPEESEEVTDTTGLRQNWWFAMMGGLVAVVGLLMVLTWLSAS